MFRFLARFRKKPPLESSPDEAKRLGIPKPATLEKGHEEFLREIIALIDGKKIDTKFPDTLRHEEVYRGLSPEWQAKVDLATPNIVSLLERIMDLHARPENDASAEMKNLIETLWQAKERIERHADVFIF